MPIFYETLDLTTIIVTHDREEAFELADRIAVLINGQIQQHAEPEEVYERPVNLAVARFMGANVLTVRSLGNGGAELTDPGAQRLNIARTIHPGPAHLAIVPEQVRITENSSDTKNVLRGQLVRCQYCGGEYRLRVQIGDQTIEARSKAAPRDESLFVQLPAEALHVIEEAQRGEAQRRQMTLPPKSN